MSIIPDASVPATPAVDPNAVPAGAATATAAPAGDPAATPPSDELILNKFKTVDDLKTSYTELEKKLNGRAPKEYAFDHLEDDKFRFSKESPQFKAFIDMAKEKHLSQEQAESILTAYKQDFLARSVNPEDEIKKLGPDGQEQVNTMRNWLQNNLSQESFEAFQQMGNDARFIRALQELKGKMRQQPVPTATDLSGRGNAMTEAKLKQEMLDNRDKYINDASYRSELDAKFRELYG